jgi:hypothetical protein
MANGGGHFVAGSPEPQGIFFGEGTGRFTGGSAAFAGMAPSLVREVLPARAQGTKLTITPHAIDRAGNEAIGAPFEVLVSER